MRLFGKIVIIFIATFLIILSALYFFLLAQGKSLFIKKLSELTYKKITVGYFGVKPPLTLEVRGLEIGTMGRVDAVFVSLNALGLLSTRIILNDVVLLGPQLSLEKNPIVDAAQASVEKTEKTQSADASFAFKPPTALSEAKKEDGLPVIIKNINIKDGRIIFTDNAIGPSPLKIIVKDITFHLSNLYLFKRQAITDFKLTGRIPWQEGQEEGKVELDGWINLFKKDMQAVFKIKDIDGLYLYPYYSSWVDLEKARIQKAKLNFTSNIQGLNNNLTLDCKLELSDIIFKPRLPEEQAENAERIAAAVLDIFKTLDQGKVVLNFVIKTKMDKPEFGIGQVRMAFEDKLVQARKANSFGVQDVAMLPGKILEGTFKGATDLTKAALVGTFSIGKGVKNTLADAFRREPKEAKQ